MFAFSSARYPLIAACLVAACMAVSLEAAAQNISSDPNAAMRYIAVVGQADGNQNSEVTGALGLTIGEHAWVRGGVGSIRLQQGNGTLNPTQ